MLKRWGPFRWWHGLYVETDSGFVNDSFDLRFYGVGFWHCPVIFGWTFWRMKKDDHHLVRADAERAAGMEGDG